MTFEATELKMARVDERNIDTIHEYERYLKKILPFSEIIKDMYIDVDFEEVLTDAYFFTDSFMIEIPDFITFYGGKFHAKKMHFIIHPIKDAIVFLEMEITDVKNSNADMVKVKFSMNTGSTFTFSGKAENSQKLESITTTYLLPNLQNG